MEVHMAKKALELSVLGSIPSVDKLLTRLQELQVEIAQVRILLRTARKMERAKAKRSNGGVL